MTKITEEELINILKNGEEIALRLCNTCKWNCQKFPEKFNEDSSLCRHPTRYTNICTYNNDKWEYEYE